MAEDKQKLIGSGVCESNNSTQNNAAEVCEKTSGATAEGCDCDGFACDKTELCCENGNAAKGCGKVSSACAEEDTLFSALAKVSLKTLYYLFITLAVLAVFISQLFPYLSMRFYYDFEGYETAVKYAKKYTKTGGDKRTEALLFGIEMSEALMFESPSTKNAEYLLYFTDEFAALPYAEFEERCAALDDYYQNAYAEGRISLAPAVGLYSFRDYVLCKNVAARSVLGMTETLPSPNLRQNGQAYTTTAQLEGLLVSVVDGDYTPDLAEIATILNMLSENMTYGGSLVFDQNLEWVTTLYRFAAEVVAPEGDGYSYLEECRKAEGIERLYFVRAAAGFAESSIDFFEGKGLEDESNAARELFVIESGGAQLTISGYYGELLKGYK